MSIALGELLALCVGIPFVPFCYKIKTKTHRAEENFSIEVPSYHKLRISAFPPLPCLSVWNSPTHPPLSLGLDQLALP